MIDAVDPTTLIETTRQTAQAANNAAQTANFYGLISIVVQSMTALVLGYFGYKAAIITRGVSTITASQNSIAESQKEVAETIKTLEKNTNSIKDALVLATKESSFAKGILEEKRRTLETEKDKK